MIQQRRLLAASLLALGILVWVPTSIAQTGPDPKVLEAAKKEAEQLAKSQDRVADRYIQQQKAKGVIVKPTPIAAAPPPAMAATAKVAPAAPELSAVSPKAPAPEKQK